MTGRLLPAQQTQLLRPLNGKRVKARQGQSYLEAYDVRAMLIRIFGFANWSGDAIKAELAYESSDESGKRWWVGYRVQYRLCVMNADGTPLATYTEWAVGKSDNQPSRGDAHDMAVKTAESAALKRCAINLGSQFGLNLYQGGGTKDQDGNYKDIVLTTLDVQDETPVQGADVTAHITEELPDEADEYQAPEPKPDPRTRTAKPEPARPNVADFVARIEVGPQGQNKAMWKARLLADAAKLKILDERHGSLSVKAWIDAA